MDTFGLIPPLPSNDLFNKLYYTDETVPNFKKHYETCLKNRKKRKAKKKHKNKRK